MNDESLIKSIIRQEGQEELKDDNDEMIVPIRSEDDLSSGEYPGKYANQ